MQYSAKEILLTAGLLFFSNIGEALILDFNDLPVDTRFDHIDQEYTDRGIQISSRGDLKVVATNLDSCDADNLGSTITNHALRNFPRSELGSHEEDVEVSLSFLADHVTVCLGTDDERIVSEHIFPIHAKILAYSNNGSLFVKESELDILPIDYRGCGKELTLNSNNEPFDTFIISFGSFGESELIDRIEIHPWEGEEPEPIIDENPPVVTITNPDDDHNTIEDYEVEGQGPRCTAMVSGYVDEDRALEKLTIRALDNNIPYVEVPSELEFDNPAVVDVVEFDLRNQRAPRYFFGYPISNLTPVINVDAFFTPSYTIQVEAEDIGGNKHTAEIEYECVRGPEPPVSQPIIEGVEFKAVGMEVTQAIQGRGAIPTRDVPIDPWGVTEQRVNEVALVAGKDTLVRVYGDLTGIVEEVEGVRCYLHGWRGEEELPGSPLMSERITHIVKGDTFHNRGNKDSSCNFHLPMSWTEGGGIRLVGIINPWNDIPETNYFHLNDNNTVKTVIFHDTKDVCFFFHPVTVEVEELIDNEPTTYPGTPLWDDWVLNLGATRKLLPINPDRIHNIRSTALEADADALSDAQTNLHYDIADAVVDITEEGCEIDIHIAALHHAARASYEGGSDPTTGVILQILQDLTPDQEDVNVTLTEEVGHTLGLGHIRGTYNECTAGIYPFAREPYEEDYPQYSNYVGTPYFGASIGDWGTSIKPDDFAMRDPAIDGDIMSYCDRKWISVHSWKRLHEILRTQPSTGQLDDHKTSPGATQTMYAHLINDIPNIIKSASASSESQKQLTEPIAPYFIVGGVIGEDGKASIRKIYSRLYQAGSSDHHGVGKYFIVLLNKENQILFKRRFSPNKINDSDSDSEIFREKIPFIKGVVKVKLDGPDIKPYTIKAGVREPNVRIINPKRGDKWKSTGTVKIRWEASDPDGDRLVYRVEYSRDNGKTWVPIATQVKQHELDVDLSTLAGCKKTCRLRVIAMDGINQGYDKSDPFSKVGQPPIISIIWPKPTATFPRNRAITLKAVISDREERIPDANIIWYSDRLGKLGSGQRIGLPYLPPGLHRIKIVAYDSDRMKSIENTAIFVHPTPVADIRINQEQGPVEVTPGSSVPVTVSLNATGFPKNAEWWLFWNSPNGTITYFQNGKWSPKPLPLSTGMAVTTRPTQITSLAAKSIDKGMHVMYFGVDSSVNGKIDWHNFYYDSVTFSKKKRNLESLIGDKQTPRL